MIERSVKCGWGYPGRWGGLYDAVSVGAGGVGLREGLVSVVSPGAYCVSDGAGDFDGSAGLGLFMGDTRHLSVLRLRIGGARMVPLAS